MQSTEKRKTAETLSSAAENLTAAAGADYESELQRLYGAIASRAPFRYRAADDTLYGNYAASMLQQGHSAMRDTMGEAAALTGGYASSYASRVGQQEYDRYLRALGEAMPQFYALAYQRYQSEGEELQQRYAMAERGVQRARAEKKDAAAAAAEADERSYRRGRDSAADALKEEATAHARREESYQKLVKLISTAGYEPTDEELEVAGLTRAQALALLEQYRLEHGKEKRRIIYRSKDKDKKQDGDKPKDATLGETLKGLVGGGIWRNMTR